MRRFAVWLLAMFAAAPLQGCLTIELWERTTDDVKNVSTEHHRFRVDSVGLVDADAGRPFELRIAASGLAEGDRSWQPELTGGRPLRLRNTRGDPQFAAVALTAAPERCFVSIDLRRVDGSTVTTATVELEGPIESIGDVLAAPPAVRLTEASFRATPAADVDLQPWARWIGIDARNLYRYVPVAWMRDGVAVSDDSEVRRAFGSTGESPDFAVLRRYRLCIAAERHDDAPPTWLGIRADALWFVTHGSLRTMHGQASWSHRTNWNCAPPDSESVAPQRISAISVRTAELELNVYDAGSVVWDYAIATIATPFTVAADIAGGFVIGYLLLWAGTDDEEDPKNRQRRKRC